MLEENSNLSSLNKIKTLIKTKIKWQKIKWQNDERKKEVKKIKN
jgi:hypothetical protein